MQYRAGTLGAVQQLESRTDEQLQSALASDGSETREEIRRLMVAIFTELGPDHPLAREHRRRLSAVLY